MIKSQGSRRACLQMQIAAFLSLGIAGSGSPALGQGRTEISEAFGVELGQVDQDLKSLGFEREERLEGGVTTYSWYKDADPFFDTISANASSGTTTVDSVLAWKYYSNPAFVDLNACQRDFDGLVEAIHEKYPFLVEIDLSNSAASKRLYKHVKAVVFGYDRQKWADDRTISVQCDSGSLTSKKPRPSLTVRYALSIWETARLYNEQKDRLQAQQRRHAKQEAESKGLDPDEL